MKNLFTLASALLVASFLQAQTVFDWIADSPDHESLEEFVSVAGLDDDLSGAGPFTVFAPTDAAFGNLPGWLIAQLAMDPSGDLADALLYHVVSDNLPSVDLLDGLLTSLEGSDLTIATSGGVTVNGAMVTVADISTDNGIIHVIDAVLLPQPMTIVDAVVNSPDHELLEEFINTADLVEDMSAEGPFTLFAPTDDAFNALPAWLLGQLAGDIGELGVVLSNHLLAEEVMSDAMGDGVPLTNVLDEELTVSVDGDGNIMINGAAVTVEDIQTYNGVVHVIDAVLLTQEPTIVDVVVNSPDHELLEEFVNVADLVDDLSADGEFTLFAPTDAAFEALPSWLLGLLSADPSELGVVLSNHALDSENYAATLTDGMVLTSLIDEELTVTIGDDVMINNAVVTVTDIPSYNGVVHVIDAVLLPKPETIVQVVVDSPDHTLLEEFVIAADLAEDLSSQGPFTLFAPTDDAFNTLPAWLLAQLADDVSELGLVLSNHVVEGENQAAMLSDGMVLTNLIDEDLVVTIGDDVMINDAVVTVTDILTYNGVVHVIDAVLTPKPVTVVDVVVDSEDHETLEDAVIAAMLDDDLSDEGPFTLFAPTDDAFAALDPDAVADLFADPTGQLAQLLQYHVVSGINLSMDLNDGDEFATLEGNSVVISIDGTDVLVNDATVIAADIETYNGVVHVIDRVLSLPGGIEGEDGAGFTAYPIPADAELNVQLVGNTQVLSMRLIDMQGRVALEVAQANVRALDVSALPAGVYTLQVLTAQGPAQQAVVIR
ncbi:MAG: fasciclin domain-containing protein [Flavobacteriales bacterium]